MTEYKFEKNNNGTTVIVKSDNKILFNRLDIAVDSLIKEFEEKGRE